MMDRQSYVVVSPVRNEEGNLPKTIKSMMTQTLRPARWVIVDDGSSDGTAGIARKYAAENEWVRVVQRADRGFRKPGGGVVEAFYEGLRQVERMQWEYLVKLDGDVSFGKGYFEQLLGYFAQVRRLGIAGGDVYDITPKGLVLERQPQFHVRGATKVYRRACWEAIGGLPSAPGWDTLDEVKAHMRGFITRSFPNPFVVQHKPTGSADGQWRNLLKNGRANWVSGYHPLFVAAKCAKRLFARPYVVGAAALLTGFVSGYLNGMPQVQDRQLIAYLRQQQLNRLIGRPSIWR